MLAQFRHLLAPGGQVLAYFTHAADPEHPTATFPRDAPADRTPLAEAFRRQNFDYTCWDFSEADLRHELQMRTGALSDLGPQFRVEGNAFLYESRNGETEGTIAAIEAGCHARYY